MHQPEVSAREASAVLRCEVGRKPPDDLLSAFRPRPFLLLKFGDLRGSGIGPDPELATATRGSVWRVKVSDLLVSHAEQHEHPRPWDANRGRMLSKGDSADSVCRNLPLHDSADGAGRSWRGAEAAGCVGSLGSVSARARAVPLVGKCVRQTLELSATAARLPDADRSRLRCSAARLAGRRSCAGAPSHPAACPRAGRGPPTKA